MTYYIKQLYILTLLLVATAMTIIPVELQARSSGPALNGLGDRTGSPLSGATCAACHSGGSFTVEALISVVDLSGSPVESFVAGETYMITVLADTTSGSPNAYGFQLTLLDDTNKTIGAFSTPSAGSGLVSHLGAYDTKCLRHIYCVVGCPCSHVLNRYLCHCKCR